MWLNALRLKAFRNYAALEFAQPAEINLFVGQNAQGKSNLLEAIYFLATGRSFRTPAERELIAWGESGAQLAAHVTCGQTEHDISIQLETARPKRILLDREPLGRLSELYGVFNAVLFTPEDLQLVKGGPEQRRRFLDVLMFQISRGYRQESLRFHRVLKQRNQVLKALADGQGDRALLGAFTEQYCDAGARLTARRAQAVRALAVHAADAYAAISRFETLSLRYVPSFADSTAAPEPAWEDAGAMRLRLEQEAARLARAETLRAQTLFGPQRDDLALTLDGREARAFASQGQQRSIVLALKQAELAYLEATSGEPPVLLLDDVLSELDEERRAHLLGGISGRVQTFVTTTHAEAFGSWVGRTLAAFKVQAGMLTPFDN